MRIRGNGEGKLLRHQHFLTREREYTPHFLSPPCSQPRICLWHSRSLSSPVSGAPWGRMGTRNNTTAPAPSGGDTQAIGGGRLPQLHLPATLKEETLARGCMMELSVTVLQLCLGTASAPGASPLTLPRAGESPTF